MKNINSLSELIEYVQGRGVTCEVSQLYSLCEKLEEQNQGLQSLLDLKQQEISVMESKMVEMEAHKSCAGCEYEYMEEHDEQYFLYCGNCSRIHADEYEPKQN